jgi:membrane dipeptidase
MSDHDLKCAGRDAITRRTFLASLLATIASACAGPTHSGSAKRQQELLSESADLYRNVVVDFHAHPGEFAGRLMFPGASRELSSVLADMKEARVDAAVFSFPADRPLIASDPKTGLQRQVREPKPGELFSITQAHFDKALSKMKPMIALSPADIITFKQQGAPCAILGLEGADPLEGDLSRVKLFYDRGIRVMQLVHYRVGEIGEIMTEPPRQGGLTPFGADVVRECNRLGLLLDVAHAHTETVRRVLAETQHPIIDSHTRPSAQFQHPRSRSDDELRAVAKNGGVIAIWPFARESRGETFQGFLTSIDHVKRVAGVDHVGIGTDINGMGPNSVVGTYKEFPLIPAGLLSHGYSEGDVAKIMGGNFMRVFREVTDNRD